MPRFVDKQNSRFVNLGPCECPNTPHTDDWMKVRGKLTYGELLNIADLAASEGARATLHILALKIIEWSWVDEEGKPIPLTVETFDGLEPETASRLQELVDEPKKAADPKPSGARSRKR